MQQAVGRCLGCGLKLSKEDFKRDNNAVCCARCMEQFSSSTKWLSGCVHQSNIDETSSVESSESQENSEEHSSSDSTRGGSSSDDHESMHEHEKDEQAQTGDGAHTTDDNVVLSPMSETTQSEGHELESPERANQNEQASPPPPPPSSRIPFSRVCATKCREQRVSCTPLSTENKKVRLDRNHHQYPRSATTASKNTRCTLRQPHGETRLQFTAKSVKRRFSPRQSAAGAKRNNAWIACARRREMAGAAHASQKNEWKTN